MDNIGLFPLGIVLFPESEYPIHVFEEKYKKLVHSSMKSNIVFGINQISTSKFFEVGCTALVSKVIHRYEDGKLDIVVKGYNRYIVKNINDAVDSLWTADIEYLDDFPELIDIYLLTKCVDYYNNIADTIKSVKIPKLIANQLKTPRPSFLIAQKSGLSSEEKQDLLEVRSENKRLHYLYNHLKSIMPLLEEAEYVSKIIKNDGYYTNHHLF
jgi:Lon protease-like protein